MSDRESVLLEPAFVLHQRPYRNTSQLLECLTAEHGRIGLIAQGSRRALGGQRALLQPFVPLRLSWVRRGELGRLTGVEPGGWGVEAVGGSGEAGGGGGAYAPVGGGEQVGGIGAVAGLASARLLAGYYVNELALRLSVRGDANEAVFSCYSRCLAVLAAPRAGVARTLRLFELHFLRALGYGLELGCDVETGEPLKPDFRYRFELERGPRADERVAEQEGYWGRELISLQAEALEDEASLRAARRLLGRVLQGYLGERPLKSRAVLKDIVARGL
ncbi:MAG TPA: DNA repair protein RecO C-terminal domain-containing protein [Gammaproteobacteria bacterium]|nr:DNA repair protein RecO C-terminal domain-containing protein [Gammaproteobacteria bacterium]